MRFALWYAEMLRSRTTVPLPSTNKPKPFPTSSTPLQTPKRLKYAGSPPGIRFRITDILTSDEKKGKESRSFVLAECTIIPSRPRGAVPTEAKVEEREDDRDTGGNDETSKDQKQKGLVLFSLPSRQVGFGSGALGVCSREGLVVGREVMVWEPWHEVIMKSEPGKSHEGATKLFFRRAMLCSRFQVV
jgi:hypothetical protein